MKTDLKFGDILHLHGNKLIVIAPKGLTATKVVDEWGQVQTVVTTLFDEFYVSPRKEFHQQVLKDWRSQDLDFSRDTLGGEFSTTLEFMAEFMYRYDYLKGAKV